MSATYELERDIQARIRASDRTQQKVPPIVANTADVAYVASIYPLNIVLQPNQFNISYLPACQHSIRDMTKDPQKFKPAILEVVGAFTPKEGSDALEPSYTPAIAIAQDLARRYAQFGVFVPADPKCVTPAEVKEATAKLEVLYKQWIDINDDAWRKHGTLVDWGVSVGHIAAKHFGIDRDWAVRAGELDSCEYCLKAIKPGIVKCNHCGSILDWKRALLGGQITKQEYDDHQRLIEELAGRVPAKGKKATEEVEL